MWDVDAEETSFQDIRSPPCGLETRVYESMLTEFVHNLKGKEPMFVYKVLKQVCAKG